MQQWGNKYIYLHIYSINNIRIFQNESGENC